MYGFASPYIGNEAYVDLIQQPVSLETNMLIINTVDKADTKHYDDVDDGYNIGGDGEQMAPQDNIRCALFVEPLPIDYAHPENPHVTYGMHGKSSRRLGRKLLAGPAHGLHSSIILSNCSISLLSGLNVPLVIILMTLRYCCIPSEFHTDLKNYRLSLDGADGCGTL